MGERDFFQRIKKAALNYHKLKKNQELWTNYASAVQNFLRSPANSNQPNFAPDFIENPLIYFYVKPIQKNGKKVLEVFSVFPLPAADNTTSKRLVSESGFRELLALKGMSVTDTRAVTNLYLALKTYLTDCAFSKFEAAYNAIYRIDPTFASRLRNGLYIENGNIFYDTKEKFAESVFAYYPILYFQNIGKSNDIYFRDTGKSNDIPTVLIKQYLKECLKNAETVPTKTQNDGGEKSCAAGHRQLYCCTNAHKFYKIQNDGNSDRALAIRLVHDSYYPRKVIQIRSFPGEIPDGLSYFMYRITGGNEAIADELSYFMATAASDSAKKKRAAVICTRINFNCIIATIKAVFGNLAAADLVSKTDDSDPQKSMPSVNKLCTKNGLKYLFVQQGFGKGVVLVNDTAVSDHSLPIIKKLIHGDRVVIKTDAFPNQYLENKIHFVFVSNEPAKARKLRETLKCDYIDLTNDELDTADVKLSHDMICWLQAAFLPHGLALDSPGSGYAIQNTGIQSSDGVRDFLEHCCKREKGKMCSREDLYHFYEQYYTCRHNDQLPKLTEGRFIKAVKELLKNESAITYKKVRSTQRRYFVGLSCSAYDRERSDECPQHFQDYIEKIHANRLELE